MNKDLKKLYNDHSSRMMMNDATRERVKNNIFARLGEVVNERPQTISWTAKFRVMLTRSYVVMPLVILLFLGGTAYASADSLPGDTLYPVKRQVENARILMAPTQEAKLKLEEKFAQKRLDELERIEVPEGATTQQPGDVVNIELENESVDSATPKVIASPRQEKARAEAAKALDNLQETGQSLERHGHSDKAQEVQQQLLELRMRFENHNHLNSHHNHN